MWALDVGEVAAHIKQEFLSVSLLTPGELYGLRHPQVHPPGPSKPRMETEVKPQQEETCTPGPWHMPVLTPDLTAGNVKFKTFANSCSLFLSHLLTYHLARLIGGGLLPYQPRVLFLWP